MIHVDRRAFFIRTGESIFFYIQPGKGGFRVFGCGLSWKDTTRWRQFFTERNHIFRQIRVRGWLVVPVWRHGRLRRST